MERLRDFRGAQVDCKLHGNGGMARESMGRKVGDSGVGRKVRGEDGADAEIGGTEKYVA